MYQNKFSDSVTLGNAKFPFSDRGFANRYCISGGAPGQRQQTFEF